MKIIGRKLTRLEILLFILVTILFAGNIKRPLENELSKLTKKLSKNSVTRMLKQENIKTISEYNEWLTKNISYRSDGINGHWSTAEEVLKDKAGDCEDYAFLNEKVLYHLGYKSSPIGMFLRNGTAHAVCVFPFEGYWSVFDLDYLMHTPIPEDNAKEFVSYLKFLYNTVFIWELENNLIEIVDNQ